MPKSRLPLPPVPAASARAPMAPAPAAGKAAPAPVLSRPARTWPEDAEPESTGPAGLRGAAPRVPRQATASGASAPVYGDWTKPSRELPSEEEMRAFLAGAAPAPETSAIPERSLAGRGRDAEPVGDDEELPAARGSRAPVGGRAALRAERQAAEVARKKSGKRSGSTALLDEGQTPRKPRRVAAGLVAMAVVALGVLGVYQLTAPGTDEAGATGPATSSAAPSPSLAPLPSLPSETAPVEEVVSTPVRVPVVVLNATDVNGLAAKISGAVVGGGWESPAVGAYSGGDIAATTVYFTEGDENQRQAAIQLVDQFPQLQGPAPRFFEMPAEITTPGLVIVAAGDWQP
ncbi:LytR C-terminal domain-containing protein [Blastococcus sp. TF02A-30]|uniref:LytR C-terminal domain-containing protein n=1 Tax=Blastococcus sp. TF02A-30 TaxID=2250580 RepID=UPI000DEAD97D|nr:LytR C-terminal domain-containing protein [Blastococcus sp. TF02A-30]RBY83428.1 hypothetical protein DQ241_19280 [Blastococcus sp. TF02A-30]